MILTSVPDALLAALMNERLLPPRKRLHGVWRIAAHMGVQVHVVPAVVMYGGTAFGALQAVAGFCGDPARGLVPGRVVQFDAVKADFIHGPCREPCKGECGHTGAAGRGRCPVRDTGNAVVEVHAAQRDPAEYVVAFTGDSPVAALLALPVLAVTGCGEAARVPGQ